MFSVNNMSGPGSGRGREQKYCEIKTSLDVVPFGTLRRVNGQERIFGRQDALVPVRRAPDGDGRRAKGFGNPGMAAEAAREPGYRCSDPSWTSV
jgi:hypothetical protein